MLEVFTNEAVSAFCAQDDVPNREPVRDEPLIIEAVRDVATLSEFKVASEPDVIIFFHDGILHSLIYNTLWLDTHTK
ncbi:MAG: hypothetical protein EBZ49_08195 [Proteobacteria bacterium]|nr:hypothetical protein [Pseudomonadota bacterium]